LDKKTKPTRVRKRFALIMPILGPFNLTEERAAINLKRYPDPVSLKAMSSIATKWITITTILDDDDLVYLRDKMDTRISSHIRSSLICMTNHKSICELIDLWNNYIPEFIRNLPNSTTKNIIEYHMVISIRAIRCSQNDLLLAKNFATDKERFSCID